MEDGKLKRPRLESANPAAEVNQVDERSEDRLSFYSVPIGDPTRIGFDVADKGGWKRLVVQAGPFRERVEVLIFHFPYDFGRGWVDTGRKLAWRQQSGRME